MTALATGAPASGRATEVTAGLGLAAALLGTLSVTVGLGAAGWAAGAAVAVASALLLQRGLRRSGPPRPER